MDMIRRQAAGELSEIVGRVALDTDKRYRFHRFRSRAEDVIANATGSDRALLEAYADGVNAGLQGLGARPFEYFLLGDEPRPWAAEDSVLVVFAMYMQLNDARAIKDVRRGLAHRVLPPSVYAWMYPQGTPWDAPLMGEPRSVAAIPGPDEYSLRDIPDESEPAAGAGALSAAWQ